MKEKLTLHWSCCERRRLLAAGFSAVDQSQIKSGDWGWLAGSSAGAVAVVLCSCRELLLLLPSVAVARPVVLTGGGCRVEP